MTGTFGHRASAGPEEAARQGQEIERLRQENERLRRENVEHKKRIADLERQLALRQQNSTIAMEWMLHSRHRAHDT